TAATDGQPDGGAAAIASVAAAGSGAVVSVVVVASVVVTVSAVVTSVAVVSVTAGGSARIVAGAASARAAVSTVNPAPTWPRTLDILPSPLESGETKSGAYTGPRAGRAHSARERRRPPSSPRPADTLALRAAKRPRADRGQVRLRARAVLRLRRARRRRGGDLVCH